ncbi:DUF1653 domain-containing protein, partial [Methylorubrum extorquens]|uniref:DUF1653 domain-containing protein n=1 Tax=Methylorubrum extorquens TaxID=408 RepID=UPI0020A08564
GSLWQHKKGAFYVVIAVSRHSEHPDQWLVTYRPVAGGDDWTRALLFTESNDWAGFLDSFEIGEPWHRFTHISGPRTWQDEQPAVEESPTRAELLEMLDNVSAIADSLVTLSPRQMHREDYVQRRQIVEEARAVCDSLLRPEAA